MKLVDKQKGDYMFLFGKKNKKGKDKDRKKTDEVIKEEVKAAEVIDDPDEPYAVQMEESNKDRLSEADDQENAAPQPKEQKPERKGGLVCQRQETRCLRAFFQAATIRLTTNFSTNWKRR